MALQARAIVASKWLLDAVKDQRVGPKLRVLDTSWYLPKLRRNAKSEFKQRHIPGAAFFDIDQCCDKTSPLDHMLPSERIFADYVGNLGIGNDTHVVVYDASNFGAFSAPRVWWMFRVFGHSYVSVLNGGLKNWANEGLPVSDRYSRPLPPALRVLWVGCDCLPRGPRRPRVRAPWGVCVRRGVVRVVHPRRARACDLCGVWETLPCV